MLTLLAPFLGASLRLRLHCRPFQAAGAAFTPSCTPTIGAGTTGTQAAAGFDNHPS